MRPPTRVAAALTAALTAAHLLAAAPAVAATADPVPFEPQQPGDMSNAPTEGTLGVGNVAHRGFSVAAPENTMDAVRQAIAEESDYQGIDVHRTSDGKLVVLHDATLARTTNVETVYPGRSPWHVSDFTYDELKRLDAGRWFHGSYSGTRIPTLVTMLRSLDASPAGAFLEVKNPSDYPGIGEEVVRAVRRNTDWVDPDGTDHRLVLQSFDESFLEDVHEKYPRIPVGALGGYNPADLAWLDQINVNHRNVTAEEVARAHEAGAQVSVFVVDDREQMEAMLDLGVDAISTNRPRMLRDVLEERGLAMAHPERTAERTSYTGSSWRQSVPDSAYLATRVPVRSTLTDDNGRPVRWTWVTLQTYYSGSWHDIQSRATDLNGTVSTSLWLRRDIKVRWAPQGEFPTGAGPSPAERVDARRMATDVRLSGRDRIRKGRRTTLTVRWRSDDGRNITGQGQLWRRPRGADRWTLVRTRKVGDGYRRFVVRPRRTTRFQIRAQRGWWWRGDRDVHRVVVRR